MLPSPEIPAPPAAGFAVQKAQPWKDMIRPKKVRNFRAVAGDRSIRLPGQEEQVKDAKGDPVDGEQNAVRLLNCLEPNLRPEEITNRQHGIQELQRLMRTLGHESHSVDALNVIHIAGTHGKGSTASTIASIMNQYARLSRDTSVEARSAVLQKVGLYTSPHLRQTRERIQINCSPVSPEVFAKYFFELWDAAIGKEVGVADATETRDQLPTWFHFFTAFAFHTFIRERVDCAVIETGVGGRFDPTNFVAKPIVTAITTLGLDHIDTLGNTIEEIAWHKGGIFKSSATAVTAQQVGGALDVLDIIAKEVKVQLTVVPPLKDDIKATIGLAGRFQKINAALAIAAVAAFLRNRGHTASIIVERGKWPKEISYGLQHVRWPARCDQRTLHGVRWLFDAASTAEALEETARWFCQETENGYGCSRKRALLYNRPYEFCADNLEMLHKMCVRDLSSKSDMNVSPTFDIAVFCTNVTRRTGFAADLNFLDSSKPKALDKTFDLQMQFAHAQQWAQLDGQRMGQICIVRTVEEAVKVVKDLAEITTAQSPSHTLQHTAAATQFVYDDCRASSPREEWAVDCLVTGSLRLMGSFMEVLDIEAFQ